MYDKTNVHFLQPEYLELFQLYLEKEKILLFFYSHCISHARLFYFIFCKLAQYIALTRLMSRRHCTFRLRSFKTKNHHIRMCVSHGTVSIEFEVVLSDLTSLLIIYVTYRIID